MNPPILRSWETLKNLLAQFPDDDCGANYCVEQEVYNRHALKRLIVLTEVLERIYEMRMPPDDCNPEYYRQEIMLSIEQALGYTPQQGSYADSLERAERRAK